SESEHHLHGVDGESGGLRRQSNETAGALAVAFARKPGMKLCRNSKRRIALTRSLAATCFALAAGCGRDTRSDDVAQAAIPPSAPSVFAANGGPRMFAADQDSAGTRVGFAAPDLGS